MSLGLALFLIGVALFVGILAGILVAALCCISKLSDQDDYKWRLRDLVDIDVDKYIETWGPEGEDRFYYIGAKDMLEDLIKKGFIIKSK